MSYRPAYLPTRHPGRAAARSDAAQIRDQW
jgi:hypothetical protein